MTENQKKDVNILGKTLCTHAVEIETSYFQIQQFVHGEYKELFYVILVFFVFAVLVTYA